MFVQSCRESVPRAVSGIWINRSNLTLPVGWWHQSKPPIRSAQSGLQLGPQQRKGTRSRATRDLIGRGGLRRMRGPLVGRTSPGTFSAATLLFSGGSGLACLLLFVGPFAPGVYLLHSHYHKWCHCVTSLACQSLKPAHSTFNGFSARKP